MVVCTRGQNTSYSQCDGGNLGQGVKQVEAAADGGWMWRALHDGEDIQTDRDAIQAHG
jgi:hypothetical protein